MGTNPEELIDVLSIRDELILVNNVLSKKLANKKCRLLVVEDDRAVSQLLRDSMENSYIIYSVTTGEEAIDLMSRTKFIYLAIVDMVLPGVLNGMDTVAILRKRYPLTYYIGITGYPSKYSLAECRLGGFDDYYVKPFDIQMMKMTLWSVRLSVARWNKV